MYGFSAIGIDGIGLPAEETSDGLPAHVLWPFIASALNYNGTKGPCFFLARSFSADAAGQLTALLKKAGNQEQHACEVPQGLPPAPRCYSREANRAHQLLRSLPRSQRTGRRAMRTARTSKTSSWNAGELTPVDLQSKYDQLIAIFTQSDSVGACIMAMVEGKIDLKGPLKINFTDSGQ